jgi:photosynthetic reaction center cytochrome c subunit
LTLGVIGLTIAWSVMGAAQEGTPAPRSRPPEPPAGATSAQFYKNVKVLKKLPANQMIPTMMHVSQSLGVRCGFCHVQDNFASDAKPEKNVARQMIVMTDGINAHYRVVDKKATCYLCHHGHASPENQPPPRSEGPGGGPPGPPQ